LGKLGKAGVGTAIVLNAMQMQVLASPSAPGDLSYSLNSAATDTQDTWMELQNGTYYTSDGFISYWFDVTGTVTNTDPADTLTSNMRVSFVATGAAGNGGEGSVSKSVAAQVTESSNLTGCQFEATITGFTTYDIVVEVKYRDGIWVEYSRTPVSFDIAS
jgi:hypothetical protein